MDGRWTIRVERSNVFVDGAWLPDRSTPVVPCDDAAVERVAAALFPHIPSPYTDDEADRFARSLALMALRAAGGAVVTAVVWPQRADSTCTACRERHVVVTVYLDGALLCAGCQEMPSRVAEYRTAEEMRDAA